jgi:hypothetical protein
VTWRVREGTLGALALVTVATFLGRACAPDAALYRVVSDYALRWVSSSVEIPALVLGVVYARRAARGFGAGNPSARAWRGFAVWLALLALGQVVFSTYGLFLRRAAMITSLVVIQRAYAASGFSVGTTRKRSVTAFALTVTVAISALIAPIVEMHGSLLVRGLNVAYPLLDGVALVALFVLARTVRVLRGGRAWRVWATLLVSIALSCVGDIVFAYFYFHAHLTHLEVVVDLAFMASYVLAARAAYLQYALVRGSFGEQA